MSSCLNKGACVCLRKSLCCCLCSTTPNFLIPARNLPDDSPWYNERDHMSCSDFIRMLGPVIVFFGSLVAFIFYLVIDPSTTYLAHNGNETYVYRQVNYALISLTFLVLMSSLCLARAIYQLERTVVQKLLHMQHAYIAYRSLGFQRWSSIFFSVFTFTMLVYYLTVNPQEALNQSALDIYIYLGWAGTGFITSVTWFTLITRASTFEFRPGIHVGNFQRAPSVGTDPELGSDQNKFTPITIQPEIPGPSWNNLPTFTSTRASTTELLPNTYNDPNHNNSEMHGIINQPRPVTIGAPTALIVPSNTATMTRTTSTTEGSGNEFSSNEPKVP